MSRTIINVLLYLRVSTDEQGYGFSLAYQEESLKRFCEMKGYNVVSIFIEDQSAKDFKRPAWNNLQTFAKANKKTIDLVLFTKWDRFARNIREALNIMHNFDNLGIDVNSAEQWIENENPDRIVLLSFYLAIGESERIKISGRTKDGTYQAKCEGYYASKAPYGYDSHRDGVKSVRGVSKGKRSILVPNKEAFLVTKAFQIVAMDLEPIETTREKLIVDGMSIGKSAFNDMLKNIVYAGKIVVPEYKKQSAKVIEGKHEPLIDLVTFNKVQNVFKGKRWFGLKPNHENKNFPLRDFLTCEVCGTQVTGSFSKGRNKRYGYYHCRNKCQTRVSIDQTNDFISGLLSDLQINKNIKDLFADVLKDTDVKYNGDKAKQLSVKLEKQKSISTSIVEVEDLLLSKKITTDKFNSIATRLNSELMTINNDIEVLSTKTEPVDEFIETGLELLVKLDSLFLESDYEGKRILAGSLFTKKLVFGNNGCRTVEINEVLEVLTRNSKGFGDGKKEKVAISDNFSANVPGAGVEPARFPTGV